MPIVTGLVAGLLWTAGLVGVSPEASAPADATSYTYQTVSFPGSTDVSVDQILGAKEYSGTLETDGKYEVFVVAGGKTALYALPYAAVLDAGGPDASGALVGTYSTKTLSHGFIRSAAGKLAEFDVPGTKPGAPGFVDGTEILGITAAGTTYGTYSNSSDSALGFIHRDGKTTSYKEPDELSPGPKTLPAFTSIYDVLPDGEFGGTYLAPGGSLGVQVGF